MNETELQLVITQKGLEAAISASNRGLKAELTTMSVGDALYAPNKNQTALRNELDRAPFSAFKDLGGGSIQGAAKFSGPSQYAIGEIGLHLSDGTLFGVISRPEGVLNFKPAGGHCIQPFTLNLSALPTDSITIEVGTENLNILIDSEMMQDATAFVRSQVVQVKQSRLLMKQAEKLRKLEAKHG
ncbi:phage tail protein [Vibrio azureus]|uniref:Putative phage tail protein n=1 Tax=Vibrio azureus NBRC 104587 TaxID=1219077 RepID=U3C7V1_9VIBR|nr:phage tail protein [Vibrio azureus]AUI87563.1 phage tail protein [Vibrio azureus]GAD74533.1 putative phage tail protein [Vibrio azureus NBRC 104587]